MTTGALPEEKAEEIAPVIEENTVEEAEVTENSENS